MSQDKNGAHAQKFNRARPIEEFRGEYQQMAVFAVSGDAVWSWWRNDDQLCFEKPFPTLVTV